MATSSYVDSDNYDEVQIIKLDLLKEKGQTYTLIGQSIAATRTTLIIPELSLCFDYGFASNIGNQQQMILVTHGHADHIGSLHYHAFDRNLHAMEMPTYVMPRVNLDTFQQAFEGYYKLGGNRPLKKMYDLVGIDLPDMDKPISQPNKGVIQPNKGRYLIYPYSMKHSVPSIGYVICQPKNILKEEYRNLPSKEVGKLVREGNQVTYMINIPLIAFTGDTTFQGILENEIFFSVRILIIECTFMDFNPEETQKFAKKRGHIHIKDIEDHIHLFKNETVVLCHFSRRYQRERILTRVEELNKLSSIRFVAFI